MQIIRNRLYGLRDAEVLSLQNTAPSYRKREMIEIFGTVYSIKNIIYREPIYQHDWHF